MSENHEHYIRLNGDKLHSTPMMAEILQPSFQIGALCSAFYAAASSTDPSIIAISFGAGYLSQRCASTMFLSTFSKKARIESCIDTAPDGNSLPTSPNNMKSAWDTFCMTGFNIGITALPMMVLETSRSNWPVLPFFSAFIPSMAANFYRMGKVLIKDWVITDLPPPEPQKEKQKAPKTAPQPS